MAKVCGACGSQVADGYLNCPNCGASLSAQGQQPANQGAQFQQQGNPGMQYQQPNAGQYQQQMAQPMYQNMGAAPIPTRNIVTTVLLSLVTCGLYGLYWFMKMTDESNTASGEVNGTSGGMSIVFTLITCGIYSFFWSYKMGKKMAVAGQRYGKNINDNSTLYLILSIFGLAIVNYCLIQNDLNSLSNQQ